MAQFKVGDKVKCIECDWGDCKPDTVYEVAGVFGSGVSLTLRGDQHIYAATRFVLHEEKKTPHKHAELIKAWADGAEIQFKSQGSTDWRDVSSPQWNPDCQYRINPAPKPDRNEYIVVQKGSGIWRRSTFVDAQAKALPDSVILHLIYDGQTDKIKTSTIVQ